MTIRAHIVTGATGFVGGAMVLELLSTTRDPVLCGVRCADPASGQARLLEALEQAAVAYDREDLRAAIGARCRAFPLDLGQTPNVENLPRVADEHVFWHAAASLRYEEKHAAQIFDDNVKGVERMLGFAAELGAHRFNYVSTAYVFGRQTGVLHEELPTGEVLASNCYEVSKLEAERIVYAEPRFETRILRPSIVIGHSPNPGGHEFTGLYGFLRETRLFEREVKKRLGQILKMRPLSVMISAQAPINFIPVDSVARDAVCIGLSETDRRIFHLTNDTPPLLGETLDTLFAELRLPKPRQVTTSKAFTSLDQRLHDQLAFYSSYMNSDKTFSRVNTDAIVGAGAGRQELSQGRMRDFAVWYLDKSERGRSNRQLSTVAAINEELVT